MNVSRENEAPLTPEEQVQANSVVSELEELKRELSIIQGVNEDALLQLEEVGEKMTETLVKNFGIMRTNDRVHKCVEEIKKGYTVKLARFAKK